MKSVFTQNDAGTLTSNKIYKDGTEIATGTAATVEAKDQEFVIPSGSVKFKSTVSYSAGAIKNNNLGQPSPEGAIAAGSKNSSELTFTGKRKAFYGAGNGAVPTLNSSAVRGLASSVLDPAQGTSFSIPVAIGQQHVVFAYPATLRDVNQVMYVETNDTGMASSFSKSTVSVGGADATADNIGNYATDYKVYSYAMAAPAAAPMTFKVTI